VFGINLSIDEPLAIYIQRYSYLFDQPVKVRSMGSDGLSLAMLAAGSLDTFLNIRKKTRILDIAASYIIAMEAGVEVWDVQGNTLDAPLALKSRVSFLGFVKGLRQFFKKLINQISIDFEKQPSFYE